MALSYPHISRRGRQAGCCFVLWRGMGNRYVRDSRNITCAKLVYGRHVLEHVICERGSSVANGVKDNRRESRVCLWHIIVNNHNNELCVLL